jgi:uncharacterized repeat protein (TIGR01451 family)
VSRACRRRDGGIRLGVVRVVQAAWLSAVLCVAAVIGAAPATAASASPHWSIFSESQPTYFRAGDTSDAYVLVVRNDGALPTTHGSVVTLTDTLPSGVTATKVSVTGEAANGNGSPKYAMACAIVPAPERVECTYEESASHGAVLAGATFVVTITVSIDAGVKTLEANSATISGGGAPGAATEETTPIDAEPVPFGLSLFDVGIADESGSPDTQAASHPYELTTSLAFNVSAREGPPLESPLANAAPKDLEVAFPPGLIGNPKAVPQCSQQAFLELEALNCPLDSQVGTVKPYFYGSFHSAVYPVFNIVPPSGEPAELGFSVAGIGHIPLFFHVLPNKNGEYRLTASLNDIPESGPLQGAILTLWGVPADGNHDLEREGTFGQGHEQDGESCKPQVEVEGGVEKQVSCPSGIAARPFLTLPSKCQASELPVGVETDSWENPGPPFQSPATKPIAAEAITGCEQLSFAPSLWLAPETTQAGAPSGYTIDVHVPQNEDPTALATPDLRKAVVSLPAGVVVSPSVTNGLQDCTEEQFAPQSLTAASCPARSQLGTVKIVTPLLSSPLEGQVFLGQPDCAPCTPGDAQEGRLVRLLLQAEGSGLTVKLAGSGSIDQSTGQLTVTFDESPQLPFEELKLTLDGGSTAPLANSSSCGVPLSASSQLTPYSSETPAEPTSEPFELSGCPPARFDPSFLAGTSNNQAGAFSPLTVTLSRTDQEEDLERLTVQLAPGLLGTLSKVALCAEAQAQAGACGPQSEVGSATVEAGPGSDPAVLEGRVYLTGPYHGAPFGLSIVVPAVAGPFDLGTIDVRARIDVDPSTAALTVTSDPLPQTLDGIPLQIKAVNLDIDREGFIFNPTDCQPLGIQATLASSNNALASVSSRFQAANCATLAFKPKLTGLAHAKTSKAGGAYLHMRLVSSPGQANIAKVKVDLPKQLPVRLSTLQKACLAAVLQANPARCPAASVVGGVTVLTPILRQPLVGPVYLVSRGGAATPELEFVLQGEGVSVDVVGQAIIKHGVIAAAFSSLPDVPISTLGLVLGNGPHSLLATNLPARAKRSLCGGSLAIPTEITGQNGAVLKQTTRLAVLGCPRRGAAKRKA